VNQSFWTRNPLLAEVNLNLCSIIQQVRAQADPAVFLDTQRPPFGVEDSLIWWPQTALTTKRVVCRWGESIAFFLDGTSGVQNFASFTAGVFASRGDPASLGANPALYQGALEIWNALPDYYREGLRKIYVAGHSYGGGLCYPLALIAQRASPAAETRVWTYGAPRPGKVLLQQNLVGLRQVYRLYRAEDPVPHCPPHPTECPTLMTLLPGPIRADLSDYVQPLRGFVVSSGGVIQEREEQPPPPPAVSYSLVAWIGSSAAFGNPAHAISNYVAAFLAGRNLLPPAPKSWTQVQRTTPERLTTGQRNAVISEGVAAIRHDATNPLGVSGQVGTMVSTPSKRVLYKKKKINSCWVVLEDGEILLACSGKKKASSEVRKRNRAASLR